MKIIVEARAKIMQENEKQARKNQEFFNQNNIFCLNFMSSPGSGKTTLLEAIIKKNIFNLAVIEGDLETNNDTNRIIKAGAKAYQISTGQSCHLDAMMIKRALDEFNVKDCNLLVIENVGNLVCPAAYLLGEHLNVVLLSSTEGADKVEKYPVMFKRADILVLSKMDIAQYFDFDTKHIYKEAKKLNPNIAIFELSAKDDKNINEFCTYIKEKMESK